jgi:hypothetical protein
MSPTREALPLGSYGMLATEQWSLSFDFTPTITLLNIGTPPTAIAIAAIDLATGQPIDPLPTITQDGNLVLVEVVGSGATPTPGPLEAEHSYMLFVSAVLDANNTQTLTKQVTVDDPTGN